MMRAAAFAFVLCAAPVLAQDDRFMRETAIFVAGYERAIAGENVFFYAVGNGHRSIIDEAARRRGLSLQDYLDSVQKAYEQLTDQTDPVSFMLIEGGETYGTDDIGGWAVFTYVKQDRFTDGPLIDASCVRLVVFQDFIDNYTYTFLAAITDSTSREDAVSAIPRIYDMLNIADEQAEGSTVC